MIGPRALSSSYVVNWHEAGNLRHSALLSCDRFP